MFVSQPVSDAGSDRYAARRTHGNGELDFLAAIGVLRLLVRSPRRPYSSLRMTDIECEFRRVLSKCAIFDGVRLRLPIRVVLLALSLVFATCLPQTAQAQKTYLGMDRNDYPGDANMATLRKTFAFTGYWLNNPPGATSNTWQGKRKTIQAMGYGFLLLFNEIGRAHV